MKVGAMNNPGEGLIGEVKHIGEAGFDYVDLTVEYPQATPEKVKENEGALKDALSAYNLGLVGHMPWFLNIIHPYEAIRTATLAECERVFDTCSGLGIKEVTIHPDYMRMKRDGKEVLAMTIDSLNALSASAKDRGLTLCLENFEEDYFSVQSLKRIFESVDGLRFTLDVGHAYMKVKKTDNVVAMLTELKGWLSHVHMHDNHGFRDEHLPLGVGSIEFPKVISALKAADYDKTITLEIHAQDREYLAISKRKLREMWD